MDVQAILKTTTDELSRALRASRATMRIDPQLMDAADKNVVPSRNLVEESLSTPDSAKIISLRGNVADLAPPLYEVPIEMTPRDPPRGEAAK